MDFKMSLRTYEGSWNANYEQIHQNIICIYIFIFQNSIMFKQETIIKALKYEYQLNVKYHRSPVYVIF